MTTSARPAALAGVLVALALPAAAAAAPDLTVTRLANPPAAVKQGGAFTVKDTTANKGSAAGPSATRYYLTPDRKASQAQRRASKGNPRTSLIDVLLAGSRSVPRLRAGASSAAPKSPKTVVGVPVGTSAGRYWLLACADDRGAVRESNEVNNCRPSAKPVVVSGDTQATSIDALSDQFVIDGSGDERTLSLFRPSICRTFPAKTMSLAAAKTSARKFLTRRAGADAMRAFARSPEYRNADRAERGAGAAVISGKPGAALAALLRASDLQPKDPTHLINAAAVASSVGLPSESLAFLDAAARLDDRSVAPFGISRQNTALQIRATALAQLGRFGDAQQLGTLALQREPLLAEAASTDAAAVNCRQGAAKAVPLLQRSRRRSPTVPPLDETHGHASEMRNLPIPALPVNGPSYYQFYLEQQGPRRSAAIDREIQRENTYQAHLTQKERTETHAEFYRRNGIITRMYQVNSRPSFEARFQQITDEINKSTTEREKFAGGGTGETQSVLEADSEAANNACTGTTEDYSTCYHREFYNRCAPHMRDYHQAIINIVSRAYRDSQAYYRDVSRVRSGFAAYLADPDARGLVNAAIWHDEDGLYFLVQQQLFFWTNVEHQYESECIEPPASTPPGPQDPGQDPSLQALPDCPKLVKALSASVEFIPGVKLKANCEKVTLSLDTNPKSWITAFGEVSFDPRAGRLTILAGSKASIGSGPLGGNKAGFKSGLYVTVDSQGIYDAGWRVGPSVTTTNGVLEYTAKDEIDLSFVDAFSATFGT